MSWGAPAAGGERSRAAVSWTPPEAAGTPRGCLPGTCSLLARCLPAAAGCAQRPDSTALAAGPISEPVLGQLGMGSRGMRCLGREWLLGAPTVPLGLCRLTAFWCVTFCRVPASVGLSAAPFGVSPSLAGGLGVGLAWSWSWERGGGAAARGSLPVLCCPGGKALGAVGTGR